MVVVCGKCQRKFNLDDAKIPETGVKVRCSKCGFTFQVQKSAPPQEDKPQAPAAGSRPAAPAASPRVAPEAKKAAIVPKDEDFSDIFQPADSSPVVPAAPAAPKAPAIPEAKDEFRDLFSDEGKSPDSSTEDVFGDIFETSPAEEPTAPPPRVSAPAPPRAPEPEGFDSDQMGQEFKLDELGSADENGFDSPGANAEAGIAPPPPPIGVPPPPLPPELWMLTVAVASLW